ADHRIGRQVHDGDEYDQGDDRALSLAASAGDHRQPFAPGQADLVPGKPGERRGRTHAAAALVSTSAMNMSSRLVSLRPFCWRSSASVPSATSRPLAVTPLPSALRAAHSGILVGMI